MHGRCTLSPVQTHQRDTPSCFSDFFSSLTETPRCKAACSRGMLNACGMGAYVQQFLHML